MLPGRVSLNKIVSPRCPMKYPFVLTSSSLPVAGIILPAPPNVYLIKLSLVDVWGSSDVSNEE